MFDAPRNTMGEGILLQTKSLLSLVKYSTHHATERMNGFYFKTRAQARAPKLDLLELPT
jgi:hypothetical protein